MIDIEALTQDQLLAELVRRVDFSGNNPRGNSEAVYANLVPAPNIFREAVDSEVVRRNPPTE